MTKRLNIIVSILLSFMCVFVVIGYASLSSTLKVEGKIVIPALPKEVVITDVELVASSSTAQSISVKDVRPTNITAKIQGSKNQTVTYKIIVKNYSPYKYAYVGIEYDKNAVDNSLYGTDFTVTTKNDPSHTTNTFGEGTIIEACDTVDSKGNPLDTLTFYATYTIKKGASITIDSLLNYRFGIHEDDIGQAAVDGALSQFNKILNTTSLYNSLMTAYQNNVNNQYREDHVGNVATSFIAGVFSNDDDLVVGLFDGKLVIGEIEVKTLIKKFNADGKPGDEMVIYLTPTDILGMNISNSSTYIPDVYCAVFTNSQYNNGSDPVGTWYQIGDLYSGRAQGLRYTTGASPSSWFNADCINYSTWISTSDTFNLCDEYGYTVAAGKKITDIINATNNSVTKTTANNATQALTALLEDAKKVRDGNFTGSGWNNFNETMNRLKDTHRVYTENADGSFTVSDGLTHAQLTSSIAELSNALAPFKNWLDTQ